MDSEKQIQILNIEDILPNRFQPRIKFNEQAINELAESIKLHGVIQPIVVRRISDKYEIIAGERRYKASVIAGKTTIPAIITSLDDKNSAEVALIENVQRQDLTPIEEAISYKKILDMGYISQEALGEKLGKKQSTIANKLRLLNLNDEVQEALMENKISERHARSLLKLSEKNQVLMLNRIINERLTVRKTDEEIAKLLNSDDEGTQKEIEKGEIIMENNNVLNDFNIPTEPIVNSTPDLDKTMDLSDLNENIFGPVMESNDQDRVINPGFMDIQKIQEEAQDINKPEPSTPDLDKLLQATVPNPTQEIEEVKPAGRFFNMFKEEKQDDVVVDLEEKEVNMDFNEPSDQINNIVKEQEKTVDNVFDTQINSDQNTSNLDIIGQGLEDQSKNNVVEPVSTDIFGQNIVTEDKQPESSVELKESDIFNNTVQEVTPVEPIRDTMPNNSINFQNETIENFSNTVNAFSLTDDETFTNNVSAPVTEEDAVELNTEIPNFNSQPETINFDIQRPYQMDDSVKFDSNGDIEVNIERPTEKFVSADMKTVINTIRTCAQTIEKYGYIVDTDEMDLPDVYEVTFRIEKNN